MLFFEVLFILFIVVVAIQIIFYGFLFGNFTLFKIKKPPLKKKSVSVIICAKNEAKNLTQCLPSILNQDFHNFEIVLINDGSSDNTLDIMNAFKTKHNNIKIVDVKSNEAFWGNKKYALTLGIKAASNDYLLFTDADCKAVSNQWIKEMCCHFSRTKTIVIGYGGYQKINYSLLNKLVRFETLLTAIQYFSYAKIGQPYMGVGRNLAYKKDVFFEANGFINHMDVKSGDDDLFINEVASSINTVICISKNSFTESVPEFSFKSWIRQKRRHISTAKHYKFKHKSMLVIFYASQVLFWVLGVFLLSFSYHSQDVLLLTGIRFVAYYISLSMASRKFNERDLIIFLPILELFLISLQFYIFIKNNISKPNHWK